jgi:hypothetical protein
MKKAPHYYLRTSSAPSCPTELPFPDHRRSFLILGQWPAPVCRLSLVITSGNCGVSVCLMIKERDWGLFHCFAERQV